MSRTTTVPGDRALLVRGADVLGAGAVHDVLVVDGRIASLLSLIHI